MGGHQKEDVDQVIFLWSSKRGEARNIHIPILFPLFTRLVVTFVFFAHRSAVGLSMSGTPARTNTRENILYWSEQHLRWAHPISVAQRQGIKGIDGMRDPRFGLLMVPHLQGLYRTAPTHVGMNYIHPHRQNGCAAAQHTGQERGGERQRQYTEGRNCSRREGESSNSAFSSRTPGRRERVVRRSSSGTPKR